MSKRNKASEAGKRTPSPFDGERSKVRLTDWFPDLSDVQVSSLLLYLSELNKFNKAVNLVSPQTLPIADAVHIADAVFAYGLVRPELVPGHPVFDFGSGNGIPGLVMALIDPGHQFNLIDRDERKLEFCKHVASSARATNVSTLKIEIEDLPKHSVFNVVARGFAPLPKALLIARNVVSRGGKFFHMKGDQFALELGAVQSQLFSFWQPRVVGSYRLPDRGAEMTVIATDKIAD